MVFEKLIKKHILITKYYDRTVKPLETVRLPPRESKDK